jgi:hypothetical protein
MPVMWVWPLTLSDAANPNDSSPGRSTPVSSNAYVEAQRAHDRPLKKQHLEQRQLTKLPRGASLPGRAHRSKCFRRGNLWETRSRRRASL